MITIETAIESITTEDVAAIIPDFDACGIIEYSDWEPVARRLVEAKLGRELTDGEIEELKDSDIYDQLGAEVMIVSSESISQDIESIEGDERVAEVIADELETVRVHRVTGTAEWARDARTLIAAAKVARRTLDTEAARRSARASLGGKAVAAKLTQVQRSAIARNAVSVRWLRRSQPKKND